MSMRPDWRASGGMATVGLEIALSVLFGFLGGHWLDGRSGTAPWLTIVGTFFGVATAARFLYRAAQRSQKAMSRDGFKASQTGRSARYELEQEDEV
ncbi:MAG TPA: AtpZ/AtpI family protein [Polyangiaceae bacterium]|nr:AtpZ/AtpI family protein [Polyangiaceae bacterium]